MFLVIFLYALLASTFTFGKIVLTYFEPFFFIGIRMIIGGALLLGYLYFFKRLKFVIHKPDIWLLAQCMVFHIYLAFTLEFWALQYLTSAKACLLYNLSPFLSALFSYYWFRESMTTKKFFGLILGFAGFLPVLLTQGSQEAQEGISFIGFSLPEIMLLCSVVLSVYGWILVRRLVKDRHYSPLMVNGFAMIGGGILSLLSSFLFEKHQILQPTLVGITTGLAYMALMILVANVIYYNLYGYLLRIYSATLLSFVGFVCPLFAALYGWLFLGETIGWAYFATIFIIFWGLYIFYQEELRQGYIFSNKKGP